MTIGPKPPRTLRERGRPRWSGARKVAGLVLAVAMAGCATYTDKTAQARDALVQGDLESGVQAYNRFLKVKNVEQLPDDWRGANALAVLERGTILQAMRQYPASARDFQAADKQLELLDLARDVGGQIGKYIYSDSATKYKTSPTEKMALNAMNMINYLARGDLPGSAVEARRFTVIRKYLQEHDPDQEHGAFGSYLAGLVFQYLGEPDRALRYYDEALQEREFASLRQPIRELSARGSYRGQRIKDYLPAVPSTSPPSQPSPSGEVGEPSSASSPATEQQPPAADPGGELLVVVKVGRVPYKEPRRIPIGAAIGLGAAFIVGDPAVLQYSMFKVVVYPELVPSPNLFDAAALTVDGQPLQLELASDLTAEIVHEWELAKPKIIGAAISRMIVRAVAAEGARAAGRQAQNEGALVGFLAAAAVEGTLVALDRPDTRSWTTLPAQIHIGRARVPAGKHTVEVVVSGPGGQERHHTEVQVPTGGFSLVDVTTLR